MAHRINERNSGSWTLGGEPKQRVRPICIKKSFTQSEITLLSYFLNQISDNVRLDASDKDNQVFRDNAGVLIEFDRDRMEDLRSLLNKVKC